MNTLRTLVIFAVLGAVGFGVYTTLNRRPPVDPPEPIAEEWTNNPDVQLAEEADGMPSLMHGAPGMAAPSTASPPEIGPIGGATEMGEAPLSPAPPSASLTDAVPYANSTPPPAAGDPTMSAPAQLFPGGEPPAVPVPTVPVGSPPTNAVANDRTEAAGFGAPMAANQLPPGAEAANPNPQDPQAAAQNAFADHGAANGQMPQAPPAGNAATAGPQANTGDFAASWQRVQSLLAQDHLIEAHRELSQWHGDPRLGQSAPQVQQLLDQLAGTIIYSRESIMEQPYEVQPGDTLERIAEHYGVPWQLLAKINGITSPAAIRIGEKLKVIHGPFSADIDVTRFRMTLWLNDLYAGNFPIGVGVDHTTPEGVFGVETKLENPVYYGPDQTIDANDPNNPLGERWIALGGHYGIHGTTDPQSIGQAASRGCIRMTETDVDDVYDILTVGSRITIRR